MSVLYTIDILLNLKYEKNNINHIFQQCIESKIRLYSDTFYDMHELNYNGATDRIFNEKLEEEERRVRAKFQDTDFSIWVFKEEDLINFAISGFGIIWRKYFLDGSHRIDFARYIRLLLKVCNEFTILSLETSAL